MTGGNTFLFAGPDGFTEAFRVFQCLADAGFSIAPASFDTEIRGFKHGSFMIQPYWTMGSEDRALLDGIIVGACARGPVTVAFYASAPSSAVRRFAAEMESHGVRQAGAA